MTDLNKLLYVANIVEPNKKWEVDKNRIVDLEASDGMPWPFLYEPHKTTERGKAQLMDIVFALMELELVIRIYTGTTQIYSEGIKHEYPHVTAVALKNGFNIKQGAGKTKAEAIINLAAEVL